MKVRQSTGDRIVLAIIYTILITFALLCLYPLYLILISSFSNPDVVAQGKVLLIPLEVTIGAYEEAFKPEHNILLGYANSLFYTIVGTAINMLLTVPAAYALSHPKVKGKGLVMKIIVFTMYFSGGLIPTFLLMRELKLLNTVWSVLLEFLHRWCL